MSYLQPASASPLPEGITDPNYRPLPGRLGNLTPAQLHALETLKKQLVGEGHFVPERMDDATLLRCVSGPCTPHPPPRSSSMLNMRGTTRLSRFLRARKFDVAKAKAMLLSAEKWRKDFGVEDIVA